MNLRWFSCELQILLVARYQNWGSRFKHINVIDDIIPEPLGGAHRNHDEIADNIKNVILENLNFFEGMDPEQIYDHRKNKFLKIGRDAGFTKPTNKGKTGLEFQEPIFIKLKRIFTQNKYPIYALCFVTHIAHFLKKKQTWVFIGLNPHTLERVKATREDNQLGP